MNTDQIPSWPVFDCMGRVVKHLSEQPAGPGMVCQGRAHVDGQWLPWRTIAATVYENRMKWPRHGYQVRVVVQKAGAA